MSMSARAEQGNRDNNSVLKFFEEVGNSHTLG